MTEIIKELEITSLVHGGRGLGRHEGKAVFVSMTMPGDLISCRVVTSRRRFIEAELLEVVEPSALRCQPPCPYFGACGGCQWQHIPYPEQLRWKEKIFADLMVRNRITSSSQLKPITPSPLQWGYRNRVQLKCQLTGEGLALGFYRQGSHQVIDVEECRLVAPPIQKLLHVLRRELPEAPELTCVSQIDVACGDDGGLRIILHVLPQGTGSLRPWLRCFAENHQLGACLKSTDKSAIELVYGAGDLIVKVDQPELALTSGPGGFVQVNSQQNRNMVASMLELLALSGQENILDLFCGMGNFSLPLAQRAGRVQGVEDYAPAITSARTNAARNKIQNVDFYSADASQIMQRLFQKNPVDLVVLDPPRTGNYKAACQLLESRPQRILYISCDPATLVRDLAPLVAGGYEVISGQVFDLFPQTWHLESMTLLSINVPR